MINARRKYDAARDLSEITGSRETRDLELLRKEMLSICPPFDHLHAVWGSTLTRDPPPLRETCNHRDKEHFNRESSPEAIKTDDDEEEEVEEDATGVEDEDQAAEHMYMWITCMATMCLVADQSFNI